MLKSLGGIIAPDQPQEVFEPTASNLNLAFQRLGYAVTAKPKYRYYVPVLVNRSSDKLDELCKSYEVIMRVRAHDIHEAGEIALAGFEHRYCAAGYNIRVMLNKAVRV